MFYSDFLFLSPERFYFLLAHFHHTLQLREDDQHVLVLLLLLQELLAHFDQLPGSQSSQVGLLLLQLGRLSLKLLQLLDEEKGR